MITHQHSPYVAHIFVCTNDRAGARKSCADAGSPELKDLLKDAVNARGWKGLVRVSASGCLGVCNQGPNVMIYPQKLWFSEVHVEDAEELLEVIEGLLPKTSD